MEKKLSHSEDEGTMLKEELVKVTKKLSVPVIVLVACRVIMESHKTKLRTKKLISDNKGLNKPVHSLSREIYEKISLLKDTRSKVQRPDKGV